MSTDRARARSVIDFAVDFIDESGHASEQEIDRNFIFRFEYGWQLRVGIIRKWISELARNPGPPDLLPEDLRPKMWAYLELNKYLMDMPDITTPAQASERNPPFRPFNDQLKDRYELAIKAAIHGSPQELYTIKAKVDEEKERVRRIQSEILRIARQYQIVPLGSDLWSRFPLDSIEEQLVNLRNHLLFDYPIPKFIWPQVKFLESPTDEGITRWLRPVRARSHTQPQTSYRMRTRTRVRTWAVYFLTRRGGGEFIEERAVELWNEAMNDTLAPRNYRTNRKQLLANPSRATENG